jgi:excisionase family DNA binding protein
MPKISINEAAKVLGVHKDTLRRWEEEGNSSQLGRKEVTDAMN